MMNWERLNRNYLRDLGSKSVQKFEQNAAMETSTEAFQVFKPDPCRLTAT